MSKKCSHIMGIEYDEFELYIIEDDGKHWSELDVDWFNYCPYCAIPLKEGKPIERN